MPDDLLRYYDGRREIKFSLRTRDLDKVARAVKRWFHQYAEEFASIRETRGRVT